MYPDWFVIALPAMAVIFLWLGFLSFFIGRQNKFLKSLFPKSGERDIRKKFEEIRETVEGFQKELFGISKKIETVEEEGFQHIQRVELMRFNPYDDTGGDQSFTVALLNNEGSGIVVSSLNIGVGARNLAINNLLFLCFRRT